MEFLKCNFNSEIVPFTNRKKKFLFAVSMAQLAHSSGLFAGKLSRKLEGPGFVVYRVWHDWAGDLICPLQTAVAMLLTDTALSCASCTTTFTSPPQLYTYSCTNATPCLMLQYHLCQLVRYTAVIGIYGMAWLHA